MRTCIIDAMQMRPDSSWSATRRKRSRGRAIALLNAPSASTLENASSSAARGTRTRSKRSLPDFFRIVFGLAFRA